MSENDEIGGGGGGKSYLVLRSNLIFEFHISIIDISDLAQSDTDSHPFLLCAVHSGFCCNSEGCRQ
jgi:hypothetical protein